MLSNVRGFIVNSVKYVVVSLIFFVAFQGHELRGMFGMGKALYAPSDEQKMNCVVKKCFGPSQKTFTEQQYRREKRQLNTSAICEQLNAEKQISIGANYKKDYLLRAFKKDVIKLDNQMSKLEEAYFDRNEKPLTVRSERNKQRALLVLALDEQAQRNRSL